MDAEDIGTFANTSGFGIANAHADVIASTAGRLMIVSSERTYEPKRFCVVAFIAST